MKCKLSHIAGITGFIIGSIALTASAQTSANGPYYATPSWDQTLPAATRFIVLINMNSEAVLDRETGLVWAKTPSSSPSPTWFQANGTCIGASIGNRMGWRLPTIQELTSLIDPSNFNGNPAFQSGHPFVGISSSSFWSSTTVSQIETVPFAYTLTFFPPAIGGFNIQGSNKAFPGSRAWCVRGGTAQQLQ